MMFGGWDLCDTALTGRDMHDTGLALSRFVHTFITCYHKDESFGRDHLITANIGSRLSRSRSADDYLDRSCGS